MRPEPAPARFKPQGAAGIGEPNRKIATTSAITQQRYIPETTAPMMAPARARPLPAALFMRRTAEIPTQKAAGPSRIPRGQISTTAVRPKMSATVARASPTGGPAATGASMSGTCLGSDRISALPRPAVAADAAAPTTTRAMTAAGAGRDGLQINANAIEASSSAASSALPAKNNAPVTTTPISKAPSRSLPSLKLSW